MLIVSVFLIITNLTLSFAEELPQRIISLGSTLTEELYLLGVGDRLIADTIYCSRPSEARNKEKIGTVIDIDVEKIISLNPDLVLATSLTNPRSKEKLKNLGIKVVDFPAPENFTQICEQFLKLGRIVGNEEEAEALVLEAREKLDSIRRAISVLSRPSVFVQIGANPLYAAGKDYFINDFIEFAGGINIAADTKSGLYSREEVLTKNPDIIIITSMGIVGEEEKKVWLKFKTLNASKNNRIYIIDAYKLCSPTPVSFIEALQELVVILHPHNN